MTQNLYYERENLTHRPEVLKRLDEMADELGREPRVIDIGGSYNPINTPYLKYVFDMHAPANLRVNQFFGDINDYECWEQIFHYVDTHGKFDFCNCTHTLEDIAYPMAALRYMPRIANAGFIAVPSKYWELQRRTYMRGGIHHRWIFNIESNVLVLYPKLNFIEHMLPYNDFQPTIEANAHKELRMFWTDDIAFKVVNDDYMGPTQEAVINMFMNLID